MKKSSNPLKVFNDTYDARVKKMQSGGTATKDSTQYYSDLYKANIEVGASQRTAEKMKPYIKGVTEAQADRDRQLKKGKPGYNKNGYPIKK